MMDDDGPLLSSSTKEDDEDLRSVIASFLPLLHIQKLLPSELASWAFYNLSL